MDQLCLAINKMFFYTGTTNLLGDGKIKITPGVGEQIVNGKIDWMEVPTPGAEAWQGLAYLKNAMDENSMVDVAMPQKKGKLTLGEQMQAKEQQLRRMRIPLENIADAIDQDAYITLSWMSQVYATPEIKEFTSQQERLDYEKENQVEPHEMFATGDKGITAAYLPQLALHLEDRNGDLFDSKDSKFFKVGKDIKSSQLKWRGIFKTIPKSIVSPSQEVEKQRKMQMANIIMPLLSQPPEIFMKPVKQILKANEEDPQDWLPDTWLQSDKKQQPLFVQQGLQQGQPGQEPQGQTMQAGMPPGPQQTQTVVPPQQISSPSQAQLTGPSESMLGQ
jgi:hypothetical protein